MRAQSLSHWTTREKSLKSTIREKPHVQSDGQVSRPKGAWDLLQDYPRPAQRPRVEWGDRTRHCGLLPDPIRPPAVHGQTADGAFKSLDLGTSLVDQWYRICQPMQGTQVQSWSRKIPHATGQLRPMSHNHRHLCSRACAPSKKSHHTASSPQMPQLEKACMQQ